MKFDVFLPSLLVSPDWFADSAPPRLPAIEMLMARGVSSIGGEWPDILLAAFGANGAAAARAAAFAALGDGLDSGDNGWMFAEPAHFQADRDTLNLLPRAQLDITADETTQLMSALNENFANRGLAFFCGASGHWYVNCRTDDLPQTTSIVSARRGALFDKLPVSAGKLSWKAIQNETQMLFHSHAVNAAREAAGKLTINGLWFWGEGALPKLPIGLKPSIGAVFGDTPLSSGLAKWIGARFAPLDRLSIVEPAAHATHNVLAIDTLTTLYERGDIDAWRTAATRLDGQIFTPLLDRLRAGTVDELVLTLPRGSDSLVFTIDAGSLRGIIGWWKNLTQQTQPFLASLRA